MNNENKGIHPTGVSSRVWIALVALCVANVAAHLMVMPSLPGQIPTHWGANGAVDGWGPSWMASALGVLPLALLAMFYVVPRIDPKGEAYRTSGKFYQGGLRTISWTVTRPFPARRETRPACGHRAQEDHGYLQVHLQRRRRVVCRRLRQLRDDGCNAELGGYAVLRTA